MPADPSPQASQSRDEHELVKDTLAAVGFLFATPLPDWLYELLNDPDAGTLGRVIELIELRRSDAYRAGDGADEPAIENAPNQHDDAVNAESTRLALVGALHYWETAGCDCCAPTVLDDAIDRIGYETAIWERFRAFGIELAGTAQNVLNEEDSERA